MRRQQHRQFVLQMAGHANSNQRKQQSTSPLGQYLMQKQHQSSLSSYSPLSSQYVHNTVNSLNTLSQNYRQLSEKRRRNYPKREHFPSHRKTGRLRQQQQQQQQRQMVCLPYIVIRRLYTDACVCIYDMRLLLSFIPPFLLFFLSHRFIARC